MSTLVYFGSMTIGKPNGPGVNEYDFITDLIQSAEFHQINVYSPITASAVDEFSNYVRVVKAPSIPIVRELISLLRFIFDFVSGRIKPSVVVLRLGQIPIWHWILLMLLHSMRIPVHVKTVGVGIASSKKSSLIIDKVNFYFLNKIICGCSSLDTPTLYAKNKLLEVFDLEPQKVIIVHNGAPVFSVPKLVRCKNGPIVLGYVGRYPEVRGGRQVIQVLENCLKLGLDVKAIITGTDDEVTFLRDLAYKLEVSERVDFIGIVEKREISNILSEIDFGFSIVEGVLGTSGQKLRQYVMAGCHAMFFNDEFFEAESEDFIHEFKDVQSASEYLVGRYRASGLNKRSDIREWAIKNISYEKLNRTRLNHLLQLTKIEEVA